ncbi:maleylpyruvate isomerase N-terminal domain-containing protein [Nocardioides fonticola]|uniref:Maleylpyruvate isomerase N-terminal domain-containing protein n=1 Tax=Nocardioides fonticola TaxID=450363 RepID=A0ABP7XTX8_9ACTN
MRPSPELYLTALHDESARFAEAVALAPSGAVVPTCPDWSADDLLWHLTEVQRFWAEVVRTRPAEPVEAAGTRPEGRTALLAAFTEASAALRRELQDADPGEPAWSWAAEQTVGFTLRRQAHEALIHRVDAELTAGLPVTEPHPALADDGVAEALDVMYGGLPPAGIDFTPVCGVVAVHLTDTGTTWWTQPGSLSGVRADGRDLSGPHVLLLDPREPLDAVAAISGPASVVDRWLWKRLPDDAVRRTGDPDAIAAFEAAVRPAIE